MLAMVWLARAWALAFIIAGLLGASSAQQLRAESPRWLDSNVSSHGVLESQTQESGAAVLVGELLARLGLPARTTVSTMSSSVVSLVHGWLAQMGEVGGGLEPSGALGSTTGVTVRKLLQSGGSSPSQQPVYGQGILVSPFISIVMGAAICVGLCVFLSVCRVVVRHRFAEPLLFEATARQDPPSAALPYDILKSLPIVSFKKEEENPTFNQEHIENQCPICLIEFEPKDSLRKLPECSHYFHQSCVDEWFRRNHTCPLCRTSLLPAEESSVASEPPDATAASAVSPPDRSVMMTRLDATSIPIAVLEQGAGHAAPHLPPLEREGPVVTHGL